MFVLQVGEGLPQFLRVLHQIDRDAENASVDAQLFVSANPVTVGGNQCHLARPVAQDAAGGELGRGGRLADTGRADQRVNTAPVNDIGRRIDGLQLPVGGLPHPGECLAH